MNAGEDIRFGHRLTPGADRSAAAAPGRAGRDDIDLRQIFNVFWRGKLWIAVFTLIFAFGAGVYMLSLDLRYTARSVVMLETRETQVTDLQSVVSGLQVDWNLINTEREVLRSRELLGRVADDLGLPAKLARAAEMPAEAEPRFSFRLSRIRDLLSQLPLVGDIFAVPEFVVPAESAEQMARENTIDLLLAITTVEPVEDSYVFNIDVTSGDPGRSAQVANAIAEAYVRNQLEVKFEATKNASEWLTARVAELKQGLEEAEARVEEFNSSTSVVSEEALALTSRQLKDLRDRARRLNGQLTKQAAERAALVLARETGEFGTLREAPTPPRLRSLAAELAAVRSQGGEGVQARIQALTTRINALLDETIARLDREDDTLRKQVVVVERSVGDMENKIERQSTDLVKLRQLRREADASRLIYEHFLGRMKETSVQQGIQQADSRILSRAIRPTVPSSPQKVRGVMLGAILGLVFGAGLIFLRDQVNNTFRGSADLEAETGLPVLGTIPTAPRRRPSAVLRYAVERPASAFAEAVRNLRTALLMVSSGQQSQVIMVSSSLAGEGKTTVSVMLAQNLAALGRKVLLIEGDIRKRAFGHYFEIDGAEGVVAAIERRVPVAEAAVHDPLTGVDLLPAEESRANVADLFAAPGFAEMVAEARAHYDFVIIDTPPLLLVPDARIISDASDSVLYVVRWNETPRELVLQGLNLFRQVGIQVTGTVLSQVNARRMAGTGYASNAGSYGGYGKYYRN